MSFFYASVSTGYWWWINIFVVYSYADACRTQRHNKDERHSSLEKYTSHFTERVVCERELKTEQNCNILTPTFMAITAFLSHSPRLLNRGPGGPLCRVLVFYTATYLQLVWSPTSLIFLCAELYNSSHPPSSCGRHKSHSFNPSTVKVIFWYSSTGCTYYLHVVLRVSSWCNG